MFKLFLLIFKGSDVGGGITGRTGDVGGDARAGLAGIDGGRTLAERVFLIAVVRELRILIADAVDEVAQ